MDDSDPVVTVILFIVVFGGGVMMCALAYFILRTIWVAIVRAGKDKKD